MSARLAAKNSVLVLHRHHVDVIDVQEVGRAPIRREVALRDLEANSRRIGVLPSAGSFIARTNKSSSGNAFASASARSVVNVAMPHWRGR